MAELRELLDAFDQAAHRPRAALERYRSAGKQVVGCFPVYTPEELVHAGGMIPMGLWGGQVVPVKAGKYNPAFTCSIMRSCLEYGMTGVYDGLTCAVMPILCDTFRGMVSSWRAGTDIPLIPLIQPQNREDPGALPYLVDEYHAVRSRLEAITGRTITQAALERSIRVYNQHAQAMQAFDELACDHLDLITPLVRHNVMKSARLLEKEEHTQMVRQLIHCLRRRPAHHWRGGRIILSGITAEPDGLLEVFRQHGIAVVGDDLAQESRLYRTLIPEDDRPAMERLAAQWFDRHGCSMIHEANPARGELLVRMARSRGADGVAVCLMRFCDVEEYDYPYLSRAVESAGLPCLCLEIDQSVGSNEQSHTKIQSFAETLERVVHG